MEKMPKLEASPLNLTIRDHVAVIRIDDPHKKVNTLHSSLLPIFEQFLNETEKNDDVHGIVIISGKKDCFIAGADIAQLQAAKDEKEVFDLSREAQVLFHRGAMAKKEHLFTL